MIPQKEKSIVWASALPYVLRTLGRIKNPELRRDVAAFVFFIPTQKASSFRWNV